MTVTITNAGGGNLAFNFTHSLPSAKITDIANRAAEHLYNSGNGDHGTDGKRPFSDLSNAEKMRLLDTFIKEGLKALAYAHQREAYNKAFAPGDYEMGRMPKP